MLSEIGSEARLVVHAKALRLYDLFWYEEVGDPLNYSLQVAVSEFYPGPMAPGHQDARDLIHHGGMRSEQD